MKEKNFAGRSSMHVSFATRLLGLTITLFILILTVKAELLDYTPLAWQLILAIPLLFASLIVNTKIISQETFEKYRIFNLLVTSISTAFIANALGLLISKYISHIIGLAYFILFIGIYGYFFVKDLKQRKIYNETIIILIIILLGLLPALTVF
jgi:hypothetical protein